MEKVKKIIVRVNGNEKVIYEWNGEKYEAVWKVLKRIYCDQGELYEKVYNVDRETAQLAGWHPEDETFNPDCAGWRKFLEEKGKIDKQIIEQELDLVEFVRNYVGF